VTARGSDTLASGTCKVLMIYPRFAADTFWNFAETCEIFGAKYPAAPLGLITVAALLPSSWSIRLVNRNTIACPDGGAAHPSKDFLVGLHVARVEMPMSHGHAHVVGRVWLRPGRPCRLPPR
jgi:hypothetical protein